MASSDELILRTLGRIGPASVEQLAKALRDDQGSIRQKLQRFRRDNVVLVAKRVRVASRTQCFYALAPVPEKPKTFDGYLTAAQIKAFRESIARTPWAQMGVLV